MYPELYSELISFPFRQLGWILRKLSLSSDAGNIIAIIIYILICLMPSLICIRLYRSRRMLRTDWLLPALSILLFAVIYYMINPRLFQPRLFNTHVPQTGRMLLGSTFYSVFFGYLILRVLEKYRQTDASRLKPRFKTLLCAAIFLFSYVILIECFGNLSASISNLQAANNFEGENLTVTYVFLVLQCIINILPYALAIFILIFAIRVLGELLSDRYSQRSVNAVEKLSSLCIKSLMVILLSGMCFNVLQLLFYKTLLQISIVVSIPIFSAAFVLITLLAARYARENQKLKQDNDLFI